MPQLIATNSLEGKTVLVTGGLGFIGQHLIKELLASKAKVRILDNLLPQVHGAAPTTPNYLKDSCEVLIADILDRTAVRQAMTGSDALVHLAAETGTGQSMHAASHHLNVNTVGTALVIEEAIHSSSMQSIVLASSRAIYGEGAYECPEHGQYSGTQRQRADLERGLYDVRCPACGKFGQFVPTPESAAVDPQSIYGVSKHDLERIAQMLLAGRSISTSVLRFQNVYGPGQSLINPYTGILAIFSSLARRGEEILIFEDGNETRDFIYVVDAAQAILAALTHPREGVRTYNVGTGKPTRVIDVATDIAAFFNSSSRITISGFSRLGDIRHNAADSSLIRNGLGHESGTTFKKGLRLFLEWVQSQDLDNLPYRKSIEELEKAGAVIRAKE